MPELKGTLDAAYNLPDSLHSCSHFAWHVIQAYVPTQHYLIANDLLSFLDRSPAWAEVDKTNSVAMANMATQGALIIGGAKDTPNGHVIVVYPGGVKASGGFAYQHGGRSEILRSHGLYARAISRSISAWPGATSNGDKTIWDPWAGPKFDKVKFWVLLSTRSIIP